MPNKSKDKLSPTILLCRLTQLKAQQKYLDGTRPIIESKYFQLTTEHDLIAHISNADKKFNDNLHIFQQEKINDLNELTSMINEFEKTMVNVEGVQTYKTNEYRDCAIKIDQTFSRKLEQNNETLKLLRQSFNDIESELMEIVSDPLLSNEMTPKICPAFSLRASVKHSTKFPIDRCDNTAVRAFDEYLRAHKGYSGGWSDEEHNLFVKLKNKYKTNMTRICECMETLVPEKSREDIEQHDNWYSKFIELKDKRRMAIKKWKQERFATFANK